MPHDELCHNHGCSDVSMTIQEAWLISKYLVGTVNTVLCNACEFWPVMMSYFPGIHDHQARRPRGDGTSPVDHIRHTMLHLRPHHLSTLSIVLSFLHPRSHALDQIRFSSDPLPIPSEPSPPAGYRGWSSWSLQSFKGPVSLPMPLTECSWSLILTHPVSGLWVLLAR